MPPGATKVLLVSGSLRTESVSSAVLRTAASLAGDEVRATFYEGMSGLPHFNPDDDPDGGPIPPSVADLRRRLAEANAVLFCTPEYAGSLPGSFKNLLDWTTGGGETYGKPVAWINAASRPHPYAAGGAHQALRTVLGYTGADIAEDACLRIQVPRSAIGPGRLVVDAPIRARIAVALDTLMDYAAGPTTTGCSRPPAGSPTSGPTS
jgi:NAD(P)H-dependent FMN reductase